MSKLSLKLPYYLRVLPDFFILGAQKSGTTSLHHYLSQHPQIRTPMIKEVHFFDENFAKGMPWYRQHFATVLPKLQSELIYRKKFLNGESTPYYLFHPLVPERILATCPQARLIILLKNPIDRAYSHYQHERKRGFEPLDTFEAAIGAEPKRLKGEKGKILADSCYNSFQHMHYSYLSRGHYAEQLEQWFQLFPKNQFLIMEAEHFYQNTESAFRSVLRFLGVEDWQAPSFKKYNTNQYSSMSHKTRAELNGYFEPHNARLCQLLDRKFSWC